MERTFDEEDHRRALEEQSRLASASQERFVLLSEAASILTTDARPSSALAALARIAVSALADWCFVDLVDSESIHPEIRRLIVGGSLNSHEKVKLAEDLRYHHYPMSWGSSHGTPRVLRTGKPELLRVVGDGVLRALAND